MIAQVKQHAGNNSGKEGLLAAFRAEDVTAVIERQSFRSPAVSNHIHFRNGVVIDSVDDYRTILKKIGWLASLDDPAVAE